MAVRAFFGDGRVPGGVVAVGIGAATVKQFAVAGLALDEGCLFCIAGIGRLYLSVFPTARRVCIWGSWRSQ